MKTQTILQTIGTIASLILGIIAIEISKYTKSLEEQISLWLLVYFVVMMVTFYVMARTGKSFLVARKKYEGINYFLSISFAILHFASIPALVLTWLQLILESIGG